MSDGLNKIPLNKLNIPVKGFLNTTNTGIVLLDADFTINIVNAGLMQMFGYKQKQLTRKSINILFNATEFNTLKRAIKNANFKKNKLTGQKCELFGFHSNKTIIPLEVTIFKIADNPIQMYILIMQDISLLNKDIYDLKYLAYYDQLTNIPNRTLFLDRAETALRHAKRDDNNIAIIYIDIDDFKNINDTIGHEAGDIFLKKISNRFKKCVRDSDTVSRIGGDEFAILAPNLTCFEDASILAKRILESNKFPIKINDQVIIPKTSLGITIFPNDGDSIKTLIKNADIAMYCAKKKGTNKFQFYKPSMIK